MKTAILNVARYLLKLMGRTTNNQSPMAAAEIKKTPIVECYKFRSCPERERFNEILHTTGFIASDGILRIFYDDRNNIAVEMEVNGLTINLRQANPFPYNPRWGLARDLVHAWMRAHDASLTTDYGWAGNAWF